MCRVKERTEQTSSKGNQNKWCKDGIWYKADGLGYEALAEVLVSRLLQKTNISNYVGYEYEPLEQDEMVFHGCRSIDFMEEDDDKLVSVERLFQTFTGESASTAVLKYEERTDRIRYTVESIEQFTGLRKFGDYMQNVLTVDALFLNEDRHFHNLAVIRKRDGTYRVCPVFDHGAALFSDLTGDYPLHLDLEQCYERIEAKPFSTDFDQQLEDCENLYHARPVRAWFTMTDVDQILAEFQGIYDVAVLERVREVMRIQMRKYSYLFSIHR